MNEEKKPISEKIEDGLDDLQDTLLGEADLDGIPSSYQKDSGGRKVIKYRTRANIQKKLFGKTGLIVLAVIIGLGLIGCLIYYLLNLLLLS